MISKKFILVGCLLLFPLLVRAQILDDSTKQVYGPTTTRYLLEQDLLADREEYYTVDTTLDNFHNYDFLSRNKYRYVDLGNLGSAMRPVFYTPPAQIGVYSGFNAYNPYFLYPDDIRYYDTKSPYSSLYYVQGGLIQQLLKVDFSRNITRNWNAGFDYQRTTAPKQFGYPNGDREDRAIDSHAFAFYTRFQSDDSTYHLLAHLSHLNHTSNDLGGLLPEASINYGNVGYDTLLVDFQTTGKPQINNTARSTDLRLNYHLYHQYKFAEGFQVYHIFDRQVQRYSYRDNNPADSSVLGGLGRLFYPPRQDVSATGLYYFADSLTKENTRFEVWENKLGLKGTLSGWDYRAYARQRYWTTAYQPIDAFKRRENELFLGLWTQYRFSDKLRLYAEGELMMVPPLRDYRLKGVIETPWFKGGVYNISYSPSLIQQQAFGNHFQWNHADRNNNGFINTQALQLFGTAYLKTGGLTLMPSLTVTNLDNYIYFDQDAEPRQESFPIQLINVGVNLDYKWKVLRTQHEVIYTLKSDPQNVIRVPQFFATSRLFAEGPLFRKALYMQLGAEMHYKSNYYGDAYMPATGQFHLQNEFDLKAYPIIEVFANARINRVRLFFKFAHVNEGILYRNGYFVSPYFPGQRRTFAFGVNWLLFD